jgi:hypothetical protein
VVFVAADGAVPEHIKITAPASWSNATGPVFLLVAQDLTSTNHKMAVIHDLIDPAYEQQIGVVHRYESSQDFVASLWDVHENVGLPRVVAMERGLSSTICIGDDPHVIEAPASIMRTTTISMRGLYGCGMGRISGMGCGADNSLHLDPTVGFMIHHLARTGAYGGEEIRIFDFEVANA